jgi:hypothetical protein
MSLQRVGHRLRRQFMRRCVLATSLLAGLLVLGLALTHLRLDRHAATRQALRGLTTQQALAHDVVQAARAAYANAAADAAPSDAAAVRRAREHGGRRWRQVASDDGCALADVQPRGWP